MAVVEHRNRLALLDLGQEATQVVPQFSHADREEDQLLIVVVPLLFTCDLAATLGVSESATSQHLRLLKALRLVKRGGRARSSTTASTTSTSSR
jgi:hypothetical protein